MEEEDKIRYETLFYSQKLVDGFLSGDGARALFIRSKLPLPELTRIWNLSDVSHDNKLDVFEFSLAMHLIELKLCGQEIPSQFNPSIFYCVKNAVPIPTMTMKEKQQLGKLFELKDSNCQGYLERDAVQPMFLASGLSPSILYKIWNIADLDRDGKLSFLEFAIAFHLVKNCIEGVRLNGPVDPFRCLLDEEDAIHLCKEKLRIFDKEFLLQQKEKEKENNFFSTSCELNDADFDLLAEYLPNTVAYRKDKSEADFVDENCNTSARSKRLLNTALVQDQKNEFDRMESKEKCEKSVDSTEHIECHQLTTNDFTIDLDNIFEIIARENVEHCIEEPKYVAKLGQADISYSHVGGGIQENNDEITDVLPTPQRRTYFGKQLIFEDPIGCETIGDMEFEVDFEEIVKDIEKESVDEERRLPIARVFPIYHSLPIANEEPFEKKTAAKDSHEVDWHFIIDQDMKNEGIANFEEKRDRQICDTDNEERQLVENSVISTFTSGSWKKSTKEKVNTVVPETSRDDDRNVIQNNDGHIKNNKNWARSSEEDSIVDIVEQKRMIMQSQLEERRKLREKHAHTKTINSSDILKPGLPSVKPSASEVHENEERKKGNTEEEWRVKKQNRQTETNEDPWIRNVTAVVDKKEIRPVDIQFLPEGETVNEQSKNSVERNVAHSTETNEVKYEFKNNREEINDPSINEKGEDRRRQAEHREKLLLERIKFLERTRQKLLEEKQRNLKSKNVSYDRQQDNSTIGQEIQRRKTGYEAESTVKVKLNQNNDFKNSENRSGETRNENLVNVQPVDIWSQHPVPLQKQNCDIVNNDEEKKRLASALDAKRKSEAELENRRETELREAEKRRLEQIAKEEEERQAAKERKRNFLANLEKLKQRVVTEEVERSSLTDQTRHGLQRSVTGCGPGENPGKLSSYPRSSTKQPEQTSDKHGESKEIAKQELTLGKQHEHVKDISENVMVMSPMNKQPRGFEQIDLGKQSNVQNAMQSYKTDLKDVNQVQVKFCEKEEQLNENEIRQENFKSNREYFMKKVQAEENATADVVKRGKNKKTRPKSYYGGMFKSSAHKIIDDTLLAQDDANMENAPDFVDEEALEQFRREEELKNEHQKVSKHRRSLQRDTSYTVENIEKFWETETNSEPQNNYKISDPSEKEKVKTSSNPRRRSLVNTLTTEWNSFLDILENDKRRESETVKMRQEINAKRKQSSQQNKAKNAKANYQRVKDLKIDASKEIVRCHVSYVNEQFVESEMEILAKQSGKVKQMVKTYRRLSAPCPLEQDVLRNPCVLPEKAEEYIHKGNCNHGKDKQSQDERGVNAHENLGSQARFKEQEPLNSEDVIEIKRQQQKKIIKDNTPRRKSELAFTWSNVVSHQ